MAPKWSIWERICMLFGAPFSIRFLDLLNLLNCNNYNAKTYLLPVMAPPFRINFPFELHVFFALLLVKMFDNSNWFMWKRSISKPLLNPEDAQMMTTTTTRTTAKTAATTAKHQRRQRVQMHTCTLAHTRAHACTFAHWRACTLAHTH